MGYAEDIHLGSHYVRLPLSVIRLRLGRQLISCYRAMLHLDLLLHIRSMDPCKHPQLTQNVGFLAAYGKGPVPEKDVYPILSMCSTKLHADVTAVSKGVSGVDYDTDQRTLAAPDFDGSFRRRSQGRCKLG